MPAGKILVRPENPSPLNNPRRLVVGRWAIGRGCRCFIVAEAGQNYNGDFDRALALVAAAARTGADAVKFQTSVTEELYAPSDPEFEFSKAAELSARQYQELVRIAEKAGILLFSTPFDELSADLLDSLDMPLFKIGSGELTHHAFLRYVARKMKPVILSTGTASLEEIASAADVIRQAGNEQLVLLHCVSMYPTPLEKAHIRALSRLAELGFPVGFSDHTTSDFSALAAVALGACVIEKHFTLDRNLPGGDHGMSYEPPEMSRLVSSIRSVEQCLGSDRKPLLAEEEAVKPLIRRGIYARADLQAGSRLSLSDLLIRRPMANIAAEDVDKLIGKELKIRVPAQRPLSWNDLSDS